MDWKMYWSVGLVLLGTALSVNSQIQTHTLSYTYTALSKPSGLPGIHEFTAMGLLDGRMIDYFDSTKNEKIPRQPWMKDNLPADYWEKGTKSRKSKHQWFKVNLDILMKRLRQNDTETHVLQWQHGCEGQIDPSNNNLTFSRGKDMYSYDGHEFLYFDDRNDVWVAASQAAYDTKRKWDEVQVLKEYTKGYLEKECINWLEQFRNFEHKQLKKESLIRPPEVYVFAKDAKVKENVVLTCFATGFLPKEIELLIKRDGRILTRDDGVLSSGSRPNDDESYQRRDWVEILRSDKSRYSCEVIHAASGVRVETYWDHKIPKSSEGDATIGIVGGVIGVLAVIAIVVVSVVVFLKKKGRLGSKESLTSGSSGSSGSNSSGGQRNTPLPNGVSQPLLPVQGGQPPVKVEVPDGVSQPLLPVQGGQPIVKVDVPDGVSQPLLPVQGGQPPVKVEVPGSNDSLNSGSSDSNNSAPKDSQDNGSTASSGYNSNAGGTTPPLTSSEEV